MMIVELLADGAFAAVAAIGFGAISHPPRRAFLHIAILAAIGHSLRFFLMRYMEVDIATASFFASFTIGMTSLWLGSISYCPMTVLYIPALLPMIPGMYAYKVVLSLMQFLRSLNDPIMGELYMQEILKNALITCSVVFTLAVGATIPFFILSKKIYSLTRRK